MRRRFSSSLHSRKTTKRKKQGVSFKIYLFIFGIIALFVGTTFLLRMDSLKIKEVAIETDNQTLKQNIKEFVMKKISGNYLFFIPKANLLFVDEKQIEKDIKEQYLRIEDVSINKNLEGILEIKLTERVAVALWCSGGEKCDLVNTEGYIFAPATKTDLENKIIFEGILEEAKIIRDFELFMRFSKLLEEQKIQIQKYTLEMDKKNTVETNIGDIVFSFDEMSVENKIENLLLIIEEEQKKGRKAEFEYIDLRFGNKVFYKLK